MKMAKLISSICTGLHCFLIPRSSLEAIESQLGYEFFKEAEFENVKVFSYFVKNSRPELSKLGVQVAFLMRNSTKFVLWENSKLWWMHTSHLIPLDVSDLKKAVDEAIVSAQLGDGLGIKFVFQKGNQRRFFTEESELVRGAFGLKRFVYSRTYESDGRTFICPVEGTSGALVKRKGTKIVKKFMLFTDRHRQVIEDDDLWALYHFRLKNFYVGVSEGNGVPSIFYSTNLASFDEYSKKLAVENVYRSGQDGFQISAHVWEDGVVSYKVFVEWPRIFFTFAGKEFSIEPWQSQPKILTEFGPIAEDFIKKTADIFRRTDSFKELFGFSPVGLYSFKSEHWGLSKFYKSKTYLLKDNGSPWGFSLGGSRAVYFSRDNFSPSLLTLFGQEFRQIENLLDLNMGNRRVEAIQNLSAFLSSHRNDVSVILQYFFGFCGTHCDVQGGFSASCFQLCFSQRPLKGIEKKLPDVPDDVIGMVSKMVSSDTVTAATRNIFRELSELLERV